MNGKFRVTAFLFVLVVLLSCKDKKDTRFVIGTTDSLYSDILKEERRLLIYVPGQSNGSATDTSKRYPVLYLLDGDSHFHSVTGIMDQLTRNDLCPEMIVVAIPNTDRSRDLTPTHSLKLPDGTEQDFLKTTGGAENFTSFIKQELIPYIDSHYGTSPYRILTGHSFGGLFAINTLINHPDIFNSYVAIDPSMWWDKRKLLLRSDTVLRENKFEGKSLFVSVANTMEPGMDTLLVNVDTTGNTSHIRSIIHFAKTASSSRSANGLNFSWKYYGDDDHGSVPLISEYDALRFIFNFYKLPNDPKVTADDLARHYELISSKLGYSMLPPQDKINEAGYYFLGIRKFDQAFGFFSLNIKNYPRSANVYDSMGDYYVAVNDKEKAAGFFKKALNIQEHPTTRKKLEDLEKEK
jgi:predicted alpha/beta superfamily hydrolase